MHARSAVTIVGWRAPAGVSRGSRLSAFLPPPPTQHVGSVGDPSSQRVPRPPPQKSQHRFCSTNQARQLERVSKRKILESPHAVLLQRVSSTKPPKSSTRSPPQLLCMHKMPQNDDPAPSEEGQWRRNIIRYASPTRRSVGQRARFGFIDFGQRGAGISYRMLGPSNLKTEVVRRFLAWSGHGRKILRISTWSWQGPPPRGLKGALSDSR